MTKYRVTWSYTATVEALTEEEAIQKAAEERERDFDVLGFDVFDLESEEVQE